MNVSVLTASLQGVATLLKQFSTSLRQEWTNYRLDRHVDDAIKEWQGLSSSSTNSQEWYAIDRILQANIALQNQPRLDMNWNAAQRAVQYHDTLLTQSHPLPPNIVQDVRRAVGTVLQSAHANVLDKAQATQVVSYEDAKTGMQHAYQLATLHRMVYACSANMPPPWDDQLNAMSSWYKKFLNASNEVPATFDEQLTWRNATASMEKAFPSLLASYTDSSVYDASPVLI